jgi:hypothetical protein
VSTGGVLERSVVIPVKDEEPNLLRHEEQPGSRPG